MEDATCLRESFQKAENLRVAVEDHFNYSEESYTKALELYHQSQVLVQQLAIFSENETLDDISTTDLQFLLIEFYIGCLKETARRGDRKRQLVEARASYEVFLDRLDNFEALSKRDEKLYGQHRENPETFATVPRGDLAALRAGKIARHKEEQDLKRRLKALHSSHNDGGDESIQREFSKATLASCTMKAFQSLESIALELQMLNFTLQGTESDPTASTRDEQKVDGDEDAIHSRVDSMNLKYTGPLLDKKGIPLRPFTILDKRQQVQKGVFRPDHSLPTMTIDEYLDEERRRGGIIEGGGPNSGLTVEPDEDNITLADEATMKARAWDEFTEANPKGSGNTMNRG